MNAEEYQAKVPTDAPAYYTPREVYGEIVKVFEPVIANPPFAAARTAKEEK